MGKIVVCSEKNKFDSLCSEFDSFFDRSKPVDAAGIHVKAYEKLRLKTPNVHTAGDECVVGVGTYIYKNKIGKEALEQIYCDVKAGAFDRDLVLGSFCLLICNNRSIQIMIDRGSTYNIYYHLSKNELILTNTFHHIAKLLDRTDCEVDIDNLTAQIFQSSIIGNETVFKGIRRLAGNQLLTYKDDRWELTPDPAGKSSGTAGIWDRAYEKYGSVGKHFPRSAIFMTGGEDSRINLAIMKKLGLSPSLLYGIGNSANTFTKQEDREIVEQIGKLESLPVVYMDWRDSDAEGKADYIRKYGELFTLYRFNKNIFEEFEKKIETDFICFGYFGEIYRNIEKIEQYPKDYFSLEEFVDSLYINSSLKKFYPAFDRFRKKLIDQFMQVCVDRQLDPERLSKGDFQKLNTVYRYRADTVMNNFANQFFYTFPFLSDFELIEMVETTDFSRKNGSRVILEGIDRYAPELLEVPFFSHIKKKQFKKDTFELIDTSISATYKDKIRDLVHNETLLKLLRKIYYLSKKDKKGLEELERSYAEKKILREKLHELKVSFWDIEEMLKATDARIVCNLVLYVEMINSACPL